MSRNSGKEEDAGALKDLNEAEAAKSPHEDGKGKESGNSRDHETEVEHCQLRSKLRRG